MQKLIISMQYGHLDIEALEFCFSQALLFRTKFPLKRALFPLPLYSRSTSIPRTCYSNSYLSAAKNSAQIPEKNVTLMDPI